MGQGASGRFLPLLLLAACGSLPSVPAPVLAPTAAAIASPEAAATEVGATILRNGGNAVDAAVAIGFALAVTYPEAGNIGGGGFLLVRFDGAHYLVDCREVAPLRAHERMYLDEKGEVVPNMSLIGPLAAGVPGSVRGMWELHRRFGKTPWRDVVRPAVRLAYEGFPVRADLADAIRRKILWYREHPRFATNFERHFGHLRAGMRWTQPELGRTLERIAEHGARDFYEGETARLIVEQMRRCGGWIGAADLAGYRAVWRRPLDATIPGLGLRVVTTPPPSSGGVALIQLLRMTGALDLPREHNSARHVHLVAELEKRVFADRARYLGDPDFADVPVAALISPEYCRRRAAEVRLDRPTPTASVRPGLDAEQTTHYSVLDFDGNAVAHTTTLNLSFGSGVVVEGAGFLLNNEMDDFSARPGVPNVFGVVGAQANAIAPGKRMLSSMSPTIVYSRDGRQAILGTPGGPTIFTTNYQVLMNLFAFGMDAQQAVGAPRFHHQLLPDQEIAYEEGRLEPHVLVELREMGYRLRARDPIGDVQLILVEPGGVRAVSDPRGRGRAEVLQRR